MKFGIVSVTGDVKAYCDEEWTASVKAQRSDLHTWRHLVINTGTAAYGTRLRTLLPSATVVDRPHNAGIEPLTVRAHKRATELFLQTDAEIYLSWESDIIAPANALDVMGTVLQLVDIAVFTYPDRETQRGEQGGIGFTGFVRPVLERLEWDANGGFGRCDPIEPDCYHGPEGWMFARALRAGFAIGSFSGLLVFGHRNG